MKKLALLFFLVSCATSPPPPAVPADPPDQQKLNDSANEIEQLLARDPANLQIRYVAAATHAQAGHIGATVAHLGRLVAEGWSLGVMRADFARVTADPTVSELLSRLDALQPQVTRSAVAFTLRETDLMPEGIAFDASRGRFFVSSIRKRKIVSVAADGKARDFVPTAYDGMLAVLGMKIDPKNEMLWVASAGEGTAMGITDAERGRSALYGIDLTSGGVRKKFPLSVPGQLNDLCVTSDGRVYVTDSQNGAIYTADGDSLDLEPFLPPGTVKWVNGIVCDESHHRLYAAQFDGISAIDLGSKKVTLLRVPPATTVGGIDGLAMAGQSLIGIQNSFGRGRVIRADLSADGMSITRVEVLEAGNAEFHIPTTGTIAGGDFVYIANSQLRMFPDGKKSADFRPAVFLRMPLDRR